MNPTEHLLENVERFAGRTLRRRTDVQAIVHLAATQGQGQMFEDIIFLAKFLWNSFNVMQRIGTSSDGYPKLAAEFRDSIEKFSTLIKTVIKEGPEETKTAFRQRYFSQTQESIQNLIQLASDLSWVKNYAIDTKEPLLKR
jgi:hypothetical protein